MYCIGNHNLLFLGFLACCTLQFDFKLSSFESCSNWNSLEVSKGFALQEMTNSTVESELVTLATLKTPVERAKLLVQYSCV